MTTTRRLIPYGLVALLALTPGIVIGADDLGTIKADVEELKRQVRDANEWKNADSQVHLAGYGSVTYTDTDSGGPNASFSGVQFNPIFHYQYKDLVMLESELEIEAESDGATKTVVEYLAVDLFLNDYVTLVAGKVLSPLGHFRQNLHPAWINKLASAPAGFGHDQAAPVAEVGLQLRGGVPIGMARMNYSVYIGNGPELEVDGGEIEMIEAGGFTRDADNKKVIGGRIGVLPIPSLEIGVSAASGKAMATTADVVIPATEPAHDYDVAGVDITYTSGGFRLLGEAIQQKVGDAAASIAPDGGKWKAWYVQASHMIPQTKIEGVLRFGNYDTPHASQDQKQTAVGVNYLFASHVMAKLTYEANDGQAGSAADRNRILAQIAYGF